MMFNVETATYAVEIHEAPVVSLVYRDASPDAEIRLVLAAQPSKLEALIEASHVLSKLAQDAMRMALKEAGALEEAERRG